MSLTEILASLVTLTVLEIILGVDNLVFISILSGRLPAHQRKNARRFGLLIALVTRLILLACVVWIIGLTKPWFYLFGHAFSGRDLFLILGGLFLLVKGTHEIHAEFESIGTADHMKQYANFIAVIIQIGLFDIIFSLDSILTAIGLTQVYWIMATAITIAIGVMLVASHPLSEFIHKHPTVKMLALSFLLLIGTVLIADGFQFNIPRGYVYFAVSFSIFVEALNIFLRRKNIAKKSRKN